MFDEALVLAHAANAGRTGAHLAICQWRVGEPVDELPLHRRSTLGTSKAWGFGCMALPSRCTGVRWDFNRRVKKVPKPPMRKLTYIKSGDHHANF